MHRTRWIAVLALAATLGAACGTRLGDEAFVTVESGEGGQAAGGGTTTGGGGDGGTTDASDLSDLAPGGGDDGGGTTTGGGGDDGGGDDGGTDATTTGTTSTTGGTDTGGTTTTTGGDTATGGDDGGSAGGDDGGSTSGRPPNQASDVGVTETTIKVGNIVDKGGALGPDQFTPTYFGANAYFQYLNATQGGIHGRQVEFVTCDSKENADESFRCAQRLIEDEKVFALVANNLRNYAAAGYVSDQGVPDVGGEPIGNEYSTYPTLFSILIQHWPRDGKVGFDGTLMWGTGLFHWFAENTGITKAAVYYYSIPISKQAGVRIAQSLEEAGVETIEFEINPALPNFDSAVVTMQNEGIDAIFDAMDSNANRNMCDSMQRRNFSVKVKSTTVAGWTRSVGDTFSDVCRPSMYASGDSRPMSDRGHPEVKLFNDVLSRVYNGEFDDTMHQWHLEGWLAARMFAEEVEAMGPAPTRKGLIDRLNAYDRNTLDGLHDGLDWRVKDFDNAPPPQCNSITKWSDEAGDFVSVLDGAFTCHTSGRFFPYEASA